MDSKTYSVCHNDCAGIPYPLNAGRDRWGSLIHQHIRINAFNRRCETYAALQKLPRISRIGIRPDALLYLRSVVLPATAFVMMIESAGSTCRAESKR